jgi:hypothetical protein
MNRMHDSIRSAIFALAILVAVAPVAFAADTARRNISGIYPHLAMFNQEDECGTGAVVPWAGRLWAITYAPHKPQGSTDKLYEITPALEQIIRPESIGGTPANRLIHRESEQLFIGPYAIGNNGEVRVIPYTNMFGRPTGTTRHLFQPQSTVVYATMEEGFYDVDTASLAVTELWRDDHKEGGRKANLPGYHGKGFYTAQGVYVYANNGDRSPAARTNPVVPSGVLAEWDGVAGEWTIVRRNQFTEVTGPGGIAGNTSDDDRLWSIGWDHRSLILMLRQAGRWHSYRLPKASHCYDGAHGWNTEWPRIREIGERDLLMTMHGTFWRFPPGFSAQDSSGISPRSTYLKVIGDFCRWNDRVVFGCDDTARSEFLNKNRLKGDLPGPGKSQSNLWFVEPSRLDRFGPPLGRGAVWLEDEVKQGEASEPYLFSGFDQRSVFLTHRDAGEVTFTLEVDRKGDGRWTRLRTVAVPANQTVWVEFKPRETGAWVRLIPGHAARGTTAFFHYRSKDSRSGAAASHFRDLARTGDDQASGGLLHAHGGPPAPVMPAQKGPGLSRESADQSLPQSPLRFLARSGVGTSRLYEMDGQLRLAPADDATGAGWMQANLQVPEGVITSDEASVLYTDEQGRRWRLPRNIAFDAPGPHGTERVCREVCTERNLLNVHGTFYELPAENAGGFSKVRPIATHDRRISDFASYRGLLVLSGVRANAKGERIVRSVDGLCALWVGTVDDLWELGKPRGRGGPWKNTPVRADVPSDPYLMTGYDRKRVSLSHDAPEPVFMRLQVDVSGSGLWVTCNQIEVPARKTVQHKFPDAFGAYWVRVVANKDARATAQFAYD